MNTQTYLIMPTTLSLINISNFKTKIIDETENEKKAIVIKYLNYNYGKLLMEQTSTIYDMT